MNERSLLFLSKNLGVSLEMSRLKFFSLWLSEMRLSREKQQTSNHCLIAPSLSSVKLLPFYN